jgi:hypothetical protein
MFALSVEELCREGLVIIVLDLPRRLQQNSLTGKQRGQRTHSHVDVGRPNRHPI